MSMAEVADRLGAALDDYARARVAEALDAGPAATPQLLTVGEAARILRMGETATKRLVATGELASVKIGKLRRIPIGALNDFIRVRLKEGSTVST
jgi:excisionase family DNA binding protein